jgi:hypothetical protein
MFCSCSSQTNLLSSASWISNELIIIIIFIRGNNQLTCYEYIIIIINVKKILSLI